MYLPAVHPPILDQSAINVLELDSDGDSDEDSSGHGETTAREVRKGRGGDTSGSGASDGGEGSGAGAGDGLRHDDNTVTWRLSSNNKTLRFYNDDDLRWTIVYRARCFTNESERQRYHHEVDTAHHAMSLETILTTFETDLIHRKVLSQPGDVLKMDRLALALLLLDTYVVYPYSETAWIPFNYCALTKVLPWTRAVLQYVCNR